MDLGGKVQAMSSQKEKSGKVEGTLTPGEPIPLYHSPEEDKKLDWLLQQLTPRITEAVTHNIDVEQFFEQSKGNLVQIVQNIINNYITNFSQNYYSINTPGLRAGDGLEINGKEISIDVASSCKTGAGSTDGGGLHFSSGDVQVAPEDFLKTT